VRAKLCPNSTGRRSCAGHAISTLDPVQVRNQLDMVRAEGVTGFAQKAGLRGRISTEGLVAIGVLD
jgi:hypothetical protein